MAALSAGEGTAMQRDIGQSGVCHGPDADDGRTIPRQPRHARRALHRFAALVVLAIASLTGHEAIAVLQDKFLYFPEKATVERMETGGLQAWPSAPDFRGLIAEPAGPVLGTVIVFHGNAGHAGHRAVYANTLTRLGLRVILAEYPGYGPRGGALGEDNLVSDAEQTISLAHRKFGAPVLVVGESLGAGVAAAASARQRDKTAGLMLITPWDRLQHIAHNHYPWLPVTWLLRDRYDSAANLASFGKPVLVVVAERDSIVPARFGIALHDGLPEPKRLTRVAAAGHNDWITRVDDAWWREAIGFAMSGGPVRSP